MFLQVMNTEEKEKFFELVYKIANIDGEYAEEEQEIVNSYKNELGLSKVPETSDIDGLVRYFSAKATELKKIVLFETVGLINADEKIEKEDADLLDKMSGAFGLDKDVVDRIKSVAKKLQDVYDEVYSALFD